MVAERFAEAPLAGAVKVTTPPAHGLDGIVGHDGDGQGIGERGAGRGGLRGAAGGGSEREALALEGADVGIGRVERLAALVGGDRSGGARVVGDHTRADGRAAGEQGHGLGRPAVVAQRGQAQAR